MPLKISFFVKDELVVYAPPSRSASVEHAVDNCFIMVRSTRATTGGTLSWVGV